MPSVKDEAKDGAGDTKQAGIGWVVDDGCAPKRKAGGPAEFAAALAGGAAPPEGHRAACPTCKLLGEDLACVGVVEPKLSAAAEEWLAARLPEELESLPGLLLRKNLQEGGVEGRGGASLRKLGLCEAPGPFSKSWGPFFRRYTVSTDQLLEEMFCAGDVQPAHAFGVLIHVGGIAIDGSVRTKEADGALLSELFEKPTARRERTLCTIAVEEGASRSKRELARYLRALYAAFVLDCELRVFSPV